MPQRSSEGERFRNYFEISKTQSHINKKYIAMAAVDCLYREHKFAKNIYYMKTVKHNGLPSTADFSQ